MPNVLLIAVALWAGLFMVAAAMTVTQWRRGGGQPSAPRRDRRGAVAGLADAGKASREAVAAPVRKMVRQIRRPEVSANSQCAEVPAWPEQKKVSDKPGQAKISAASGPMKIPAGAAQSAGPARPGQSMSGQLMSGQLMSGQSTIPVRSGQSIVPANAGQTIPVRSGQSIVPANDGQSTIPIRPGQWTIPAKPERTEVCAAPGPAKMPAEPRQAAEPRVGVVADAEPGQHRPAAKTHHEPGQVPIQPDQQQPDVDVVAISERIARFYAEADRPVADWLRTLGWIGEDTQNSRLS